MKQFGFPTKEKLKQKKDIDLLFQKGKWSSYGNLRVITLNVSAVEGRDYKSIKVGVSVSKKFFKKAVDRNRIKRLLREAYRHHKTEFESYFGQESITMLFWVSKSLPENFIAVERELIKFLNQTNK